jgi:Dip2/Utp12 family protein
VTKTVQRLSSTHAVVLLTSLVDKFRGSPARAAALSVWVRAVFVHHTAHLMTVPDIIPTLSPLYQTIDARLAVFKRLLRLSGRLEIVLAHAVHAGGRAGETVREPEVRHICACWAPPLQRCCFRPLLFFNHVVS